VTTLDVAPSMPASPKRFEDIGLSSDLVFQLVTKTLHFAGELRGTDLAARLGVPFLVIEPALELMKNERHCEITGGSLVGPPAYTYRLTDAGHVRAALFLEDNHYVGALPVPRGETFTVVRARTFGEMSAAARPGLAALLP